MLSDDVETVGSFYVILLDSEYVLKSIRTPLLKLVGNGQNDFCRLGLSGNVLCVVCRGSSLILETTRQKESIGTK